MTSESPRFRPGARKLDILHEDAELLAVDKPSGMIVHPAPGHEKGTLVDVLLEMRPSIAGVGSRERPGIVHRLDIDTSGVMLVAKTQRAYLALRRMFESHKGIVKRYLAVLHGAPSPRSGELETLIGRKPWDPKRMAVVESGGDRAVTRWRTLGRSGPLAMVEFTIETGRMHQIRVHAAHLGHPVAGDPLYGDRVKDRHLGSPPARCLLHAVELEFRHPITGEAMRIVSPPPADIVYAN